MATGATRAARSCGWAAASRSGTGPGSKPAGRQLEDQQAASTSPAAGEPPATPDTHVLVERRQHQRQQRQAAAGKDQAQADQLVLQVRAVLATPQARLRATSSGSKIPLAVNSSSNMEVTCSLGTSIGLQVAARGNAPSSPAKKSFERQVDGFQRRRASAARCGTTTPSRSGRDKRKQHAGGDRQGVDMRLGFHQVAGRRPAAGPPDVARRRWSNFRVTQVELG